MTYEEKLELAERMRNSLRFEPVGEDEFARYPVREEMKAVPTREGETSVFVISPDRISGPAPTVVNLHGGGFINKRLDRDRLFCFKIADALGCRVIDVDYRLSPENVFPIALNECEDVLKWVWDEADSLGIDRENICLAGHSAGGNLAVGALAALQEKGLFPVRKLMIEYAPLDLHTDPGEKPRFKRDLPAERARGYNSFYCTPEETRDPRVSPVLLREDKLKNFPPTLVINAAEDRLAEEGEIFAGLLEQAGVNVSFRLFKDSVHGFTINRMDKHEEALAVIIGFFSA